MIDTVAWKMASCLAEWQVAWQDGRSDPDGMCCLTRMAGGQNGRRYMQESRLHVVETEVRPEALLRNFGKRQASGGVSKQRRI